MGAAAEHQSMQVYVPPPGFEPPPLKKDVLLIRIPNLNRSQGALMPVGAMNIVTYKNEVRGNLEYQYKNHCLRLLHPESPDHRPKITKLWVMEWVFCSELYQMKTEEWRLFHGFN